jgi:rubrerythrin
LGTLANVKEAIGGEDYKTLSMYPDFAGDADAEGQQAATVLFRQIARIEAHHRDRYRRLLEMVENGTVYKRDELIKCKCSVCG